MRKLHRNPNGNWCRCPFGQNSDPYTPDRDREIVGSTRESMWHEASKLDWLRSRGDKHPGFDEFLRYLELNVPEYDSLFPWLVREWKNNRLNTESFKPLGDHQDRLPFTYKNNQGHSEGMEGEDLDMLQRWMKYKKQNKQGVDIMNHEIGQVIPEASKWDAGGDVVHQDPLTGHSVYHLRNKRDLRVEGRRMQHCIGSNGQDYVQKLEDGDGLYYSVRDHRNNPLGTLSFDKSRNEYYKCGNCGNFVVGRHGQIDETGSYGMICEDCGSPLAGYDQNSNYGPLNGSQSFPVDLKKMGKRPDARFVEPDQFYGHADSAVPEDAEQTMNNFLGLHGHEHIPSSVEPEEEEEDDPEPESLEDLGYNSRYYYDAPENVQALKAWHDEDYASMAPDEYHDATNAADHHDLEHPDLEMRGLVNWDSIFQDLLKNNDKKLDPEEINRVFSIAKENDAHDYLADQAKDWLENEYEFYLDPYGRANGPGFMGSGDDTIGPIQDDPSQMGFMDDKKHVHLPSQHYPDSSKFPNDEYIARNLAYQIQKHAPTDPQTGEPMGFHPPLDLNHNETPTYSDPDDRDRGLRGVPGGGPTMPDLPYTGDEWTNPDNPSSYEYGYPPEQMRLRNENDFRNYEDHVDWPREGQRPQWQGEDRLPTGEHPNNGEMSLHDRDSETLFDLRNQIGLPRTPDKFMTPGMENIYQHQRPFPGMEFGHPSGGNQYPFDPMVPYGYEKNQQQGDLFPKRWYVDYENKSAHETDLPPELFPPEHYGIHEPKPDNNQYTMWEPQSPGQGSLINTQDEYVKPNASDMYNADPELQEFVRERRPEQADRFDRWQVRPQGEWYAHTNSKESGAWTDYENENNVNRKDGWALFDEGISPHKGDAYNNGSIIQFNPKGSATGREDDEFAEPDWFFRMPGFEWRVPTLYHHKTGKMYVGREGMEHNDLARQFALPKPWNETSVASNDIHPGFVDLSGVSGDRGLNWYGNFNPQNNPELSQWVEDQYGVRKAAPIDLKPEEIWSSYHPNQDDEWAADDEPVFSVTLPEGRWRSRNVK